MLPGLEAQQLAIYLGWLLQRTWGGIFAGVLFVLLAAAGLIAEVLEEHVRTHVADPEITGDAECMQGQRS